MPYVGILQGERIGPWEVDDGQDVECPLCDDPMRPRCGEGTHRERHFWHYRGSDCAGESDEHRRMKAVAAAQARENWPDAEIGIEVATGGIDTTRIADVLVTFDEFHETLGAGLAIECQHKNKDKDYIQVSWDHAQANYSTVWLESEHFDGRTVNIGAGDWQEWRDWWSVPKEHIDLVVDDYPFVICDAGSRNGSNIEDIGSSKMHNGYQTRYKWHDLSASDIDIADSKDVWLACPNCWRYWRTTMGKVREVGDDNHVCDFCDWEDIAWGTEIHFSRPSRLSEYRPA